MPYCTIEEAWNQSLNPELYNINKHIDDKSTCKKKNNNRKTNMSRTYNKLKEHSGPTTRLKPSKRITVKPETAVSLNKKEIHPAELQMDPHIDEFNLSMYDEALNAEYKNKVNDLNSNVSIMEDFKENDISESHVQIIKDLRFENNKLKTIINELKNNKSDDKDSFLDLVVFIATGIMIILMMENINNLVRKF